MLKEFMLRMKQAENRRLFATLITAKVAGVLLVLALMKGFSWYFATPAFADDAAAAPPAYINPINTMWDRHCVVPRVLHAGGLHDARGGLRANARDR